MVFYKDLSLYVIGSFTFFFDNIMAVYDLTDIVVAVERDRRNFSINEGGNPHSTLKEWEDNGHLPWGWPELAVTGDIRPEDILRHLGVPTVILADHVPSVEQAKMTVENRFEQAMMLHNN